MQGEGMTAERFRPSFSRSGYAMPVRANFLSVNCTHMSAAQVGAYMLILMAIWSTNTCDIPDDDVILARVCRTTKTIWKRHYSQAVRSLLKSESGRLFCPYLKQASKRLRLPSSHGKINRRPLRPELVRYVNERDNGVCHHCGVKVEKGEIDHLHPWSRGGTDEPDNLVLSCRSCNRSKGSRTVAEWKAASHG
jgi:5-methylcytosine-specific restriction endonuclease McrA